MTMLIDGHNDLAWAMRQECDADLDAVDLTGVVPGLHTDLKRLTAGGVAGQFSVYVSPEPTLLCWGVAAQPNRTAASS